MFVNLFFCFICYSLDNFFYFENELFCLCFMFKGLYFMSLGGVIFLNKKWCMWVIGYNMVLMYVGFYFLFKVLVICF